ncbi:hypothetical protein FNV43_RR26654 [Rhamnella rubrinervis]|uniref:Protein kinase domain-containing protein n=1 Tax=Rhamnella rubrinervis TaxID=2594499 RepID=A0A8K0DMZ3_9ROSA|nr:hypothetical protein FNV43_RR26654 [Rhamnella rubrinervis]
MAAAPLFLLLVLIRLVSAADQGDDPDNQNCPTFPCGKLGNIRFPFYSSASKVAASCRFYQVNCTVHDQPTIQLKEGGHWYGIVNMSQGESVFINGKDILNYLEYSSSGSSCESLESFGLPEPSAISDVSSPEILSVFKCNSNSTSPHNFTSPQHFYNTSCGDYNIFYNTTPADDNDYNSFPKDRCSFIQLPAASNHNGNPNDLSSLLGDKILIELDINYVCVQCERRGRACLFHDEKQYHFCASEGEGYRKRLKLGLGIGLGLGGQLLLSIIFYILCCYKKKNASSNFLSRNITDPHLSKDLEGGSGYFGVPVFSYKDLEKATNNFDREKELGDGGFGTVYHGKLKDGREVAVKRLYEHNYKRVEQFRNEVEILTRLRHKNLVSLYGCTSRHSRELLLVYEYIPKGTVADHLHGDRAQPGSLPWSIRMSIAIETATALTYLHASDIVHRDVKTNNILLDNNFSVKVADFGLSDCSLLMSLTYQLVHKELLVIFGVVLIELISSMPAVDITRQKEEINLANLATNKIQKCEFNELIDPSIGFESDGEVRRMTIAVAELAFQCLQQNKEMRPSMEEVLETLESIEKGEDRPGNQEKEFDDFGVTRSVQPPPSPECDEIGLLKNMRPPLSPISVTQKWPSTRSITPNDSG